MNEQGEHYASYVLSEQALENLRGWWLAKRGSVLQDNAVRMAVAAFFDVPIGRVANVDGKWSVDMRPSTTTCGCCGRQVPTPFHHHHRDTNRETDYCQECYDAGCDLLMCSLPSTIR